MNGFKILVAASIFNLHYAVIDQRLIVNKCNSFHFKWFQNGKQFADLNPLDDDTTEGARDASLLAWLPFFDSLDFKMDLGISSDTAVSSSTIGA